MNVEEWREKYSRTSVRVPTFTSSAPLMPKQQAVREDLQRRYQAIVDADARKRKLRDELEYRLLLAIFAELGPQYKWKTIHELRRIIGDERTNPRVWPELGKTMQRHFATLKQKAGEPLNEAERRAVNS